MNTHTVVVNLLSAKSGGGLRVCRTFLQSLASRELEFPSFFEVIVANNGIALDEATRGALVEARSIGRDVSVVDVSGSRALAEVRMARLMRRSGADVVYTPFGPPPLLSRLWARSTLVSGCAYSNLFAPEVDFWASENKVRRWKRAAIDWIRLVTTRRADVVIMESEFLQRRAARYLPRSVILHVRPCVNQDLLTNQRSAEVAVGRLVCPREVSGVRPSRAAPVTFGFLSGHHPNKRWEVVVDVVKSLASLGIGPDRVRFSFSVPTDSAFADWIGGTSAAGYCEYVGAVDHRDLPQYLDSLSALVLLSELESFSNNVLEAWASDITLVISDREWAHRECGEAALYVEPTDGHSIAGALCRLIDHPEIRQRLEREGRRRLSQYPTQVERTTQILSVLTEAASGRIRST